MAEKDARIISFIRNSLLSGKVIIFIACLFLSLFFWLISELNRTGTHSISIPVRFINTPDDKMISGELPGQIELKIKGSGIRLFLISLKKFNQQATIDFRSLKKVRENAFSVTSANISNLSGILSQEVEVTGVFPEMIYISTATAYGKYVPIKANVLIESESSNQLIVSTVCIPDKIKLSGDSNSIKNIDTIYTEKIIIDEVKDNLSQKANLIFPDGAGELFSASRNSIVVKIDQDKLTDASLDIPIEVVNLPDNSRIKLFPEKVKVFYQVGLKSYEKMRENQFKAFVDFKEYTAGKEYLKIHISKTPSSIRNVKILPEKAEFIIKK